MPPRLMILEALMGEGRIRGRISADERAHCTTAILRDLLALEVMLEHDALESGVHRMGAEQELFLVDDAWRPAPVAMEVLDDLDDAHFTTEFARFNLEINIDPVLLGGDCFGRLERDIDGLLAAVRSAAEHHGADVYLGGILPTLRTSDLDGSNMTPEPRYAALDEALAQARGGPHVLQLKGADELSVMSNSSMLEAACTSFQVHLQVDADDFARFYNAAQVVIAPVLAAATNSPILFGRRLWSETRIPVFQQAIDTRNASYHLRERAARVSFGQGWVDDSALDLFREGVARFRALIAKDPAEDPLEILRRGEVPELRALQVHNGTVYRWNRACYGVTDNLPHLRIENRALPAGPTVADEVANAAFFLGAVLGLAGEVEDVRARLPFSAARANFAAAAQFGLNTQFRWLDGKRLSAQEVVLEALLPTAAAGLEEAGVDGADIRRYLGVIEARVTSGRSGSTWALDSIAAAPPGATRHEIVTALTAATVEYQRGGSPVHEWPLARMEGGPEMSAADLLVEDFMTTDVFAVAPEEPLALTGYVMDWKRIRHVPIEDQQGRLVGLLSSLDVISHLSRRFIDDADDIATEVTVGELMTPDPLTVSPRASIREAIELMRNDGVECLPVVEDGQLVGIVSEHDFVQLVGRLLD